MNSSRIPCVSMFAFVLFTLSPAALPALDAQDYDTAVEAAALPEKKQTVLGLYLTAAEVSGFRAAHPDALMIDVRTRAEVGFVGIAAEADRNIPYMVVDDFWEFDAETGTYMMVVNPGFGASVADVLAERNLSADTPIILICRSGSRSARAADLLAGLGFTSVISVVDGFEGDTAPDGVRSVNGWKNSGLDWSYRIRPEQAY